MQTTKQQLLVLLKRTGSVTVEEAAGALAVASMTARQHLVGLECDGLVQADRVKRSTGRPHYLYTLTSKAEEMFPRRYDLLAQVLLDEAASLNSTDIDGVSLQDRRIMLIRRAADRLAEQYRFQVEGRTLPDRVAAVTNVLQLIGGFAEWCECDSGYEIRDYNCVFSRLVARPAPIEASAAGHECEWHVRLLTQMLRWPVRHELVVDGRVECCRYIVSLQEEGTLVNA
jgi:predicted ArsR family transcriptional regulator